MPSAGHQLAGLEDLQVDAAARDLLQLLRHPGHGVAQRGEVGAEGHGNAPAHGFLRGGGCGNEGQRGGEGQGLENAFHRDVSES
jgi:hypothetical protein